jgi:hypothetical protein
MGLEILIRHLNHYISCNILNMTKHSRVEHSTAQEGLSKERWNSESFFVTALSLCTATGISFHSFKIMVRYLLFLRLILILNPLGCASSLFQILNYTPDPCLDNSEAFKVTGLVILMKYVKCFSSYNIQNIMKQSGLEHSKQEGLSKEW